MVCRASGLSRVTITKGIRELGDDLTPTTRIRREGAGRPSLVSVDPTLPGVLEALVEPLTRGDPESPLRWTCKSTRTLARELAVQDHPVSHVGTDHDTSAFAVASVRGWWRHEGRRLYPQAIELLITADSGGSSGKL